MANLLADGVANLHVHRKAHMSSPVVYSRGAASVTVSATVGRTVFEAEDDSGSITRVTVRDFILTAADLVLDGSAAEPQAGDEIRETVGSTVFVHEVMPVPGEGVWRWSDPHRVALRVHTKQTGTEAAP